MTSQPVKKITAGQVDDQKTDGLLNYTIFSKKNHQSILTHLSENKHLMRIQKQNDKLILLEI